MTGINNIQQQRTTAESTGVPEPQQQPPTGIPGVGDNSPERHRASQLPQGPGASGDDSTHRSILVGRSGGKPRDKLMIVMTFTCNPNSTSDNNQPQPPNNFIESSHTKQGHRMPAGVCWKKLIQGAGVLTISIRSPEYPGLV
jgi:hypothetical protein